MTTSLLALLLIVFLAFLVETTAGFGATVVTVTLSAHFIPIPELLHSFVPVNLVLSTYLVISHRRDIDFATLGRRILPLMMAGLLAGIALHTLRAQPWLKALFGVLVVILSVVELWRQRQAIGQPLQPLPRATAGAALLGAGLFHGLFACGGPLAVYVAGREIGDKGTFRATLSTLWLILSSVLVASFVWHGEITTATATRSGLLLVPLALGIVAGERLHDRLSGPAFRRAIFLLLLVAGLALSVRTVAGG
jgi:uncharacterized membrane protein YfcA